MIDRKRRYHVTTHCAHIDYVRYAIYMPMYTVSRICRLLDANGGEGVQKEYRLDGFDIVKCIDIFVFSCFFYNVNL